MVHITRKIIRVTVAVGLLFIINSPAQAAKIWKIAVADAAGSSQHELTKKFAETLSQKTNGKNTVRLFINSQLGSEQDTVNDVSMGTLDFSILAINNLTPFSPSVGVLTLPYLIRSIEDAVTLTQGEVSQELVNNTIRDAGVRIVGWAYSGFRVLTNSKKPISTLQDLQGVVIRVPKNEIMIATYKAWGINPTPMAWSETFTALQQRVVDGQDNPYTTVHAMKFYEVQKYITNLRYIFSVEPLIMNESLFQKQPPVVRQAILDAGRAATQFSVKWLTAQEANIKKDLLSKGMIITDPANNETEWIDAAIQKVWPKFYKSIGGKDRLNRVLVMLGRDKV